MTELKTIPQILSTQTVGVPDWAVGLLVLVAQGMVIQSVMQLSPTTEPAAPAAPDPVTLKDMAMLFTEMKQVKPRLTQTSRGKKALSKTI